MKVYFDVRMLNHPGIGRYIKSVVPLLKKKAGVQLVLLGDREAIYGSLGIEEDVIDFTYPIYSMQEQLGFRKIKKTVGDDILHVPHYNIPAIEKFNLIVTIHDLIYIFYPRGASKRLASTYMKVMVGRAVDRAKKIICVSHATKEAIKKFYNVDLSKIEVIHEGASEHFNVIADRPYLESIRKKYHLPEKFILYVGSIRRHKNVNTLLKAFAQLRERVPDAHLVIIGKFTHYLDFNKESVRYLGEIPDDRELVAIYNLASVFCNLSLYEGFSLTVLEAQKCKLPVVCSNIAPHLEIGGDSVVAVPPTDIDQIVGALYNVLTQEDLRDGLIGKGNVNLARFSWPQAVSQTMQIYENISALKD
jgi:glycosyltransferase involved in cell wall biosynthesis